MSTRATSPAYDRVSVKMDAGLSCSIVCKERALLMLVAKSVPLEVDASEDIKTVKFTETPVELVACSTARVVDLSARRRRELEDAPTCS